jgi:hypothetical protein
VVFAAVLGFSFGELLTIVPAIGLRTCPIMPALSRFVERFFDIVDLL